MGPQEPQPQPNQEDFARLLADAIRQAGETAPLRYDADHFRLVAEGEGSGYLNLDNVYREYQAAPESRRQTVLRNFIRTWFSRHKDTPDCFEDARHDLLPGLRDRSYFELFLLRAQVEDLPQTEWPYLPLGEHFGVGLIYDLPEAMRQLQQDQLTTWGVNFEEAFQAASQNLWDRSQHSFEELAPGLWRSPWQDNYDVSRLLLLDLIRQHPVQGDPVAMAPNRDILLLTGSEDQDGLARLASLAEEALQQPRPLSGAALRLEGDTWVPFLPTVGHPQHYRFKRLLIGSLGEAYAGQKELLDALHEKQDEDLFVASYTAVQKKETGRVRSYCVWSEGVDTLLPQAETVYFFVPQDEGKGDIVASGSWERVQEVVGELMEPLGLYPERYRVQDFPTEEQLELLQEDTEE